MLSVLLFFTEEIAQKSAWEEVPVNVGGVFVTIWPATENSFTAALIVNAMIILAPTTMGRYVEVSPCLLSVI